MFSKVRILVADNEKFGLQLAEMQISDMELSQYVDIVGFGKTTEEVRELVKTKYFDAAFIDLVWGGSEAGSEAGKTLLKYIQRNSPGCLNAIVTAYKKEHVDIILDIVSATTGGSVYFVNKNASDTSPYAALLHNKFRQRMDAGWAIENLAEISRALAEPKRLARIENIRQNVEEIEHELSAILFDVFNESASISLTGAPVKLSLRLIRNQGRSSSLAVEAHLSYGRDSNGDEITGNRCFLKIGPVVDIENEARRYSGLIRMGVATEFRVDMVGWAKRDALAAVCYSFAGGIEDDGIRSLDSLLEAEQYRDVFEVISTLFNAGSKSWMQVAGKPKVPQMYYAENFKFDIESALTRVDAFLAKLPDVNFDAKSGSAGFHGYSLRILRASSAASPNYYFKVGCCLVHGDLHGGNVVVGSRTLRRINMIDYATAGMGPRFADGAALSVTIRAYQARFHGSASDVAKYEKHDFNLLVSLLKETDFDVSRFSDRDREFYSLLQQTASVMFSNFETPRDVQVREWALTQLVYGLSVFQMRASDVEKVRILAAVSASVRFLGSSLAWPTDSENEGNAK